MEMGTPARTAEALERKIEKHIKEHADDMKNLKTEIASLKKAKPKIQKDHQPFNINKRINPAVKNEKVSMPKPLKTLQCDSKITSTDLGDKVTNNNKLVGQWPESMRMCVNSHTPFTHTQNFQNMLNHRQHQQHHPNDDELLKTNNGLCHTDSLYTQDSFNNTCPSLSESVITKINYNGCIMSSPVSPIKLLQFLVIELKTKLKDYVPEGEIIASLLSVIY